MAAYFWPKWRHKVLGSWAGLASYFAAEQPRMGRTGTTAQATGVQGSYEYSGFGHAGDDVPTGIAKKEAAENISRGFNSFDALKTFLGSPGEGKVWHHIVEQSKVNQFGAKAIHNVDNVIAVPEKVNSNLNALYSSIRPDITGSNLTIREWLSTKSLQQNYDFGRWALHYISE